MERYHLRKTGSSFEARRFRAREPRQQVCKQNAIPEAPAVTSGAVSQWLKLAREERGESVRRRIGTGALRRLTTEQRAKLQLLA